MQSIFDVTFDLTSPSEAFVAAAFFTAGAGIFDLSLTDSNGQVIATENGVVVPHDDNGLFLLDSGRYRLAVQVDKSSIGVNSPDGGFNALAQFSATPIPEPGSAGLLALGLALLASRRPRSA